MLKSPCIQSRQRNGVRMNRKIIFCDIDGTILSPKTNLISDNTFSAIKKAQANGHLVFVNSGRTIAEIEKEISRVGFDGYVCGCGTYISYHNSVLFHNTLPKEMIPELIRDLKTYKAEAILEGVNAIYFDRNTQHPKLRKLIDWHINKNEINIQDFQASDISVDKFCMWYDTKESFDRFYEKYKDYFEFIHRRKNFYEVVPKECSKATGIEFLLNYLNISHENTYALGDGPNDLPMLTYVKHSIAMGNCDPEIRNLVSFITGDVDEDGVSYAFRHFNII